jgi:hypothetical protein
MFDVLRLFRGRLIWHRMMPRFHDGIVEAFVAAARIVTLLATVVGLHYDGAGFWSYIAGPPDLVVKRSGDMVQQCVQGNSQSSFRIDSLHLLSIARRWFSRVCHTCSHSVRPGPTTC